MSDTTEARTLERCHCGRGCAPGECAWVALPASELATLRQRCERLEGERDRLREDAAKTRRAAEWWIERAAEHKRQLKDAANVSYVEVHAESDEVTRLLDSLVAIRTAVLATAGDESEFYGRWLGDVIADPHAIPDMVRDWLARRALTTPEAPDEH